MPARYRGKTVLARVDASDKHVLYVDERKLARIRYNSAAGSKTYSPASRDVSLVGGGDGSGGTSESSASSSSSSSSTPLGRAIAAAVATPKRNAGGDRKSVVDVQVILRNARFAVEDEEDDDDSDDEDEELKHAIAASLGKEATKGAAAGAKPAVGSLVNRLQIRGVTPATSPDERCTICLQNQRTVANEGCGHISLCLECVPKPGQLAGCPFCRAPISYWLTVK